MLAAAYGHQMACKILVQAQADLDAQDNQGFTARHLASRAGHASLAKLLVR